MSTARARARASHQQRPLRWGQLVWGAALVVLGVAWFLDVAVGLSVVYPLIGAALLIGVGFALPLAPAPERGGILGLGVLLTIAVLASTIIGPAVDPVAIGRGVGDVTVRPVDPAALPDRYEHGVGDLTVDLRAVALPLGGTEVDVELAVGTLVVRVPTDLAIDVSGHVGLGEVTVLGDRRSGAGLSLRRRVGPSSGVRALQLDLSVGIGRIEVIR